MKRQILVFCTAITVALLSVGSVAAQDGKKMKMNMAEMHQSPHHAVMMAYRHNVLTFAKVLRDMAQDGKLADVDVARNAFAEIKQSMAKMEEIHQLHMGQMSAEMREKMKPMMEKMETEQALVKEHILALETALQAAAPDVREVEKHAAALVSQLEKMDKPGKKMAMPGKKQM